VQLPKAIELLMDVAVPVLASHLKIPYGANERAYRENTITTFVIRALVPEVRV